MQGPRPTTIRRRTVALCVVLCVALAGCNSKPATPRDAAAAQSRAEKARKDAEAKAAEAKAKAEGAVRRDISLFGGRFTVSRETWQPALHAKAEAAAKAPPAAPNTPAVPAVPVMPVPPALVPAPEVAAKGPPAPAARAGPPAVVRERVVSVYPYGTEAEAEDDALTQACDLIEQKLAALDPPVRHRPSVGEVRAEFVRKDSRTVRTPDADARASFAQYGISGNLVYVEYDIEVTADQVRELRAQDRVSGGLRVLGVLTAVALAGFLFLRADDWTRGYLTSWLALGAVALAAGAAVALILV